MSGTISHYAAVLIMPVLLNWSAPGLEKGEFPYKGSVASIALTAKPIQIENKDSSLSISDAEHKGDLEKIVKHIRTEFPPFATVVVSPLASSNCASEGIKYFVAYNPEAHLLFVTKKIPNRGGSVFMGEKRYTDYGANGLRIGTPDEMELFQILETQDVSLGLMISFDRPDRYEILIDSRERFVGSAENARRKIMRTIEEYKKDVSCMARELRTNHSR